MACNKCDDLCSQLEDTDIKIKKIRRGKKIIGSPTRRSKRIQARAVKSPEKLINKSKLFKKEITRKSTIAGYERTFDKYSPSKEIALSPIKGCQANLIANVLDDHYFDIYSWCLSMSEQHFYDNAFLLLSYSKHDVVKTASILHRGFIPVDKEFFKNLQNVILLGKGSYGSVYSCFDPKSNQKYAIKLLAAEKIEKTRHTRTILDYLAERNASIRAMDSTFIVRFFYSMRVDSTGDLLLFFEYCVGDLDALITRVSLSDPRVVSKALYFNKERVIQELYKSDPDMLEAIIIYVFEVFAALDFLMQCNIIHQDIKPNNIMISENLHLKIGDFGLSYKTRPIHRKGNTKLVAVDLINKSESSNYSLDICGTKSFQDFELHMMWMQGHLRGDFDEILRQKAIFNAPGIDVSLEVFEPTFLVDTWAGGTIAALMLFRGLYILHPSHFHSDVFQKIPREAPALFLVCIVAQMSFYTRYIHDGFVQSGGKDLEELMEFLASIFTPRKVRCKGYTKSKQIYHVTKLVKMRFVDIDKVEKIKVFSERNITRSNIHLREIYKKIRNIYPTKVNETGKGFGEFFFNTSTDTESSKTINLDPAVTINFFV